MNGEATSDLGRLQKKRLRNFVITAFPFVRCESVFRQPEDWECKVGGV